MSRAWCSGQKNCREYLRGFEFCVLTHTATKGRDRAASFGVGGAKEECVDGFFFFWGGGPAWEFLFNSDNAIITIKLLIFFLAIGSQNLKYHRL